MDNCLFCKIATGEIPSNKVYEDDTVLAFYDIDPQAPVHVLIVPKKHYTSIQDVQPADAALLSRMFEIANKLAKDLGISEKGFRLVINTGEDGGQSVPHLHMHMMGGRKCGWPAG